VFASLPSLVLSTLFIIILNDADELRAEVRREFDAHREVPDRHTQKYLLSDGKTRLKQLSEMLGMQR